MSLATHQDAAPEGAGDHDQQVQVPAEKPIAEAVVQAPETQPATELTAASLSTAAMEAQAKKNRRNKIIAISTAPVVAVVAAGITYFATHGDSTPARAGTVAAGNAKPGPETPTVTPSPSETASPTDTPSASETPAPTEQYDGYSSTITKESIDNFVKADKPETDALVAKHPELGAFMNPNAVAYYFDIPKQITIKNIEAVQAAGDKFYSTAGVNTLGTPDFAEPDTDYPLSFMNGLLLTPTSDIFTVAQNANSGIKAAGLKPVDMLNMAFLDQEGPYLKDAKSLLSGYLKTVDATGVATLFPPPKAIAIANAWSQSVTLPNGKKGTFVCYTAFSTYDNKGSETADANVFALISAGNGPWAQAADGPKSSMVVALSPGWMDSAAGRVVDNLRAAGKMVP